MFRVSWVGCGGGQEIIVCWTDREGLNVQVSVSCSGAAGGEEVEGGA